jgi:hypothetical protein
MAGWADLYNPPPGVPLGFTLGDINTQGSRLRQDAAVSQFEQARGFGRAAADTVSHFSAQGAGRSSAKNLATNRMFEDYTSDAAKSHLNLDRALDDLRRQRALATFGVIY